MAMGSITLDIGTIVAFASGVFTFILGGYVFLFKLAIEQWKESHKSQLEVLVSKITEDRVLISQIQTKLTTLETSVQNDLTAIKVDNAKSDGKYSNLLTQITDVKTHINDLAMKMDQLISQSARQGTKP